MRVHTLSGRFFKGSLSLFLVNLGLIASISHARSHGGCPDAALEEKEEDCPWAEVSRALTIQADSSEGASAQNIRASLKKALPGLYQQMEADAKNPTYRGLWGKSINFDEYAKGIIVHPAILSAIGTTFGLPETKASEIDSKIVHAGMEHIYGYLFSVLKTPFGYKRARWVRPTLEQGFGLPPTTLSPMPKQGTLFSNLTHFLGRIAFRNDPKELTAVTKQKGRADQAPKALIHFPYEKLKITRLIETVTASDRKVLLRTDFIPFSSIPSGQNNTHLLLYSVVDPALGGARLITAFPVETSFVEKALNPMALGTDKTVMTRYNAFIEGFTGKELKGERQVESK